MKPFSITESIPAAFENVNRAPMVVIGGAVLAFGINALGQCGGRVSGSMGDLASTAGDVQGLDPEVLIALLTAMAAGIALSCGLGVLVWIAQTWLVAGHLRVAREVVTGGDGAFPTLFSGRDVLFRLLLLGLLVGMVNFGTFTLAGLPSAPFFYWAVEAVIAGDIQTFQLWMLAGLVVLAVITVPIATYVWAGVRLATYAVALDGMGVMESLEHSWSLADGKRIRMVNFAFVNALFGALGLLACCVGVVYTGTVAQVAWVDAYLRVTGKLGDSVET